MPPLFVSMEASLEDPLGLEAFAHVIAHDMGAPLRGISIHLRLLERQLDDPEAARQRIQLLQARLRQMDGMLREVREFSRAAARSEQQGPTALRDAVIASWRRIEAEKHTLSVDGDGVVRAGALVVHTVLGELLRNAVEHDDRDGGEVRVEISDGRVVIRDDGPGFPAAPEVMWQPFAKAGANVDDGRGAGLALVRHVLHRAGGDLRVETSDRGTTATALLPS